MMEILVFYNDVLVILNVYVNVYVYVKVKVKDPNCLHGSM